MFLENTIKTRGRVMKAPTVIGLRSLSADEVTEVTEREAGIKPSPLQRINSRHRRIARALADGCRVGDVAAAFNMTASRISVLQTNPAFQELIQFYRAEADIGHETILKQLEGLGEDSIDTLRTRLEEDPEAFDNNELASLIRITMDRTGYGPSKKEERNINVNIGDRLEAARQRVIESEMKDITPVKEAAE